MERPIFDRRTIPLWADLVLVVISLCCTTHMTREMADSLSFSWFEILMMVDMIAGVVVLISLPLTKSGRKNRG